MRNKGHGWTFLPTLDSAATLSNSYDFRLTIEPALFLLPSFKPDEAALERVRLQHVDFVSLRDPVAAGGSALFHTDASFHEMLAAMSGNAFFLQAIQQQNRLRRLLEFSSYTNRRRVRAWLKEHLEIIEAVSEDDLARASRLMRQHLTHATSAAAAMGG
jgi:DNA-binding GntR family transcriptional regulator